MTITKSKLVIEGVVAEFTSGIILRWDPDDDGGGTDDVGAGDVDRFRLLDCNCSNR